MQVNLLSGPPSPASRDLRQSEQICISTVQASYHLLSCLVLLPRPSAHARLWPTSWPPGPRALPSAAEPQPGLALDLGAKASIAVFSLGLLLLLLPFDPGA